MNAIVTPHPSGPDKGPGSHPSNREVSDGGQGTRAYAVSLDEFEGPLDLLIHLVRRHELDILNIPISFVASKYMEYLDLARILDIDMAGDYLVMAATLAYLKSRELLPAEQEDESLGSLEEGPDPREALIARLVAYERFKFAAQAIDQMPQLGLEVFDRGAQPPLPTQAPVLAPLSMTRLFKAYEKVLERARIRQEHHVVIEPVTVRQRMVQLGSLLEKKEELDLAAMMLRRVWRTREELRAMLVVTLMSVLELVKLGVLEVDQSVEQETVLLRRRLEIPKMQGIIRDFRGDDEDDDPLVQSSDEDASSQASGAESEPEVMKDQEQRA